MSEIIAKKEYAKFVHLHCHSDYSLYDGFQKIAIWDKQTGKKLIGGLVKRAADLNMKAIALTDHGKVGGFIKFYKACKVAGIKPIFGCENYICNNLENKKDERFHLTVLAKNYEGYKNLLKISTISHKYMVKVWNNEIPRIDWNILKQHFSGLVVLSGCIASEFSKKIVVDQDLIGAEEIAKKYKDVFGNDYYIEVMWTGHKPQLEQIKHATQIAAKLGIKVVMTNDAHFSVRDEAKYQRAKISISRNAPLPIDESFSDEYYIKSYDEMSQIISTSKGKRFDFLYNTMEIEEKCDVQLKLGQAQLPHFEIPKDNEKFNNFKKTIWGMSEEEAYLNFLAIEGLKWRGKWDDSVYRERLFKELETIKFTGFIRYFLVTEEFVRWAREVGKIMTGVGRGSAIGSLATYCLGITNVDPVKYNLSMDRFLYAEANYRVAVEDFFNHVKREEKIQGDTCSCGVEEKIVKVFDPEGFKY